MCVAVCASSGFQNDRLVDPVGLLEHPLAEAERLEHLHGAAGDAVGLAEQQRAGLLLDDAGLDVGKGRQLRGQRQPRRAAADDQDVDFLGKAPGNPRRVCRLAGSAMAGSPGLEPVEMKLHDASANWSRIDRAKSLRDLLSTTG